jgi:hypothetical protein
MPLVQRIAPVMYLAGVKSEGGEGKARWIRAALEQ